MGAWAEDTFGDDMACDWTYSFLENPGLAAVREAIQTVIDTDGYLDSREACQCLAACEVIARAQGKWGLRNGYSEELDRWVEANPITIPEELKTAADEAIARILGDDSELPAIWDDGGRSEAWHGAMDDLRRRVKGE
ncbi:MAG: DUF4259 domain-containing protein [Cyanobacteria bacterium P01_D01_bin.73]